MRLTDKQLEYALMANRRHNIKVGATGAGKTFVDFALMIPRRVRERSGRPGLNVIMGVSQKTVENNILAPMRDLYPLAVGEINKSTGIVRICGEDVHVIGAEKINAVKRIRGATFKYLYGDEVAEWHEDVFNFVKSRLRTADSIADYTLNPEHPTHFMKKFIDDDSNEVYCQHYTIDDNPYYPEEQREQLKREYYGTILYDRLILGEWKRAEGSIYRLFADNPTRYEIEEVPDLAQIHVGLDFGESRSNHSITAVGFTVGYCKAIALGSRSIEAHGTLPEDIDNFADEFVGEILARYGRVDYLDWDNASPMLGRGIQKRIEGKYATQVRPCWKDEIKNRIDVMVRLLGSDRFKYVKGECDALVSALCEAVYDTSKDVDTRLDNFTSDIDTLDSFEYCFTRIMDRLVV